MVEITKAPLPWTDVEAEAAERSRRLDVDAAARRAAHARRAARAAEAEARVSARPRGLLARLLRRAGIRQDRNGPTPMTTPAETDRLDVVDPTRDLLPAPPRGKARSTMIETQGPALEAESTYRREKARDALAVRRAAYERRAERAARAEALAAGQTRGITAVLRGWRLPRSGAWHAAR